jgi:hypothetical protein
MVSDAVNDDEELVYEVTVSDEYRMMHIRHIPSGE